jgi:succinate-semialdehyde dehydrogenase/glutarate-semialdehyde dehydrogenase
MPIQSINPATGEILEELEAASESEIDDAIAAAHATFQRFRATSFSNRGRWMTQTADVLERRKHELARVVTLEMGKPIKAAVAEIEKCALTCRYYAQHAERFLADEPVKTDATRSFIRFQPLGVVLAVMPWNFPFWQAFRFIAPALMAGNVALLKHASNVPRSALWIERIVEEGGFPKGTLTTLLIASDQVGRILEDERVRAATLTGSEPAGSSVGSTAARAIKKSVLELGGSDPFIVMPSADLEKAVTTGVKARVVNNGQSCIAAKRFILHEAIADRFTARFVESMKALRVGDPLDEKTDVGPLATPQILRDLDRQVRESVAAGARLLAGGKPLSLGRGNFYEPTVLADIREGAPAYAEETFGPVASLFRVADIEHAIRLANATPFGLGASVWTSDEAEIDRFIDGIDSGQVFVNAMVASDPRLPFGGVKHSGFGRELGVFGIREFVNVKTIWIDTKKSGGKGELSE